MGFPAIVSSRSPNEKLNLVFIGVGGRGAANIKELTGVALYTPPRGKDAKPETKADKK